MDRQKQILLIEDNPSDQYFTKRALEVNNVDNELVIAADGQSALEMLLSPDGQFTLTPPDLVLLDLNLPRIHGLEVLKQIRATERLRFLPVVVLTTGLTALQMEECYELGASSVIIKPDEYTRYPEVICHVVMYWLLLNVTVSE